MRCPCWHHLGHLDRCIGRHSALPCSLGAAFGHVSYDGACAARGLHEALFGLPGIHRSVFLVPSGRQSFRHQRPGEGLCSSHPQAVCPVDSSMAVALQARQTALELSAAERLAVHLYYAFMPALLVFVVLSLVLAILIQHWECELPHAGSSCALVEAL